MNTRTHRIKVVSLLTSLFIAAGLALAGPLNPPSGPIAPTGKTTQEVFDKVAAAEPRVAINATNTPGISGCVFLISQPGSYYLTQDLIGVPGKSGIWIGASNVTIDLNGFSVRGNGSSGAGIASSDFVSRLEVRNGTVNGWGAGGIDLVPYSPRACIVRNVKVHLNLSGGIKVSDSASIIDCRAFDNTGFGISALSNGEIVGCHAERNSSDGIAVGNNTLIDRCVALDNSGDGISASTGSTVTNSIASDNTAHGFNLTSSIRATNCSANSNGGYGFYAEQSVTITDCHAVGNATSAVRLAGSLSEVSRCTLTGASGFPVIDMIGNGNQISANRLSGGTFGVSGLTATNALVVGNHCISHSSGAFNLGATCQTGPIVTATGTITATSPFANFVR